MPYSQTTFDEQEIKAASVRKRWYAIQVMAGHEDRMCNEIARVVELQQRRFDERAALRESKASEIVQRVFVPKMRVGVKRDGKWLPGEEVLMPGYLIAVTRNPDLLSLALRRVDGFAKLVSQDNVFVPLSNESVAWMERHTQSGKAAADMSEGYVEGGKLHVTSGPLMGQEALVVKVNHRKKVAYLEVEMFGRKVNAQLGIRITRNRNSAKNN